jgi:peptide/nickel transport system substrate-binding protein
MKRFIIPLVTILVLSFLIAGCSGTPTTTTAKPTTAVPTTSAPIATSAAPTTSKPAATTSAAPTTLTPVSGGILRLIDSRGPSTTLGWFAEAGAGGGPYTSPNLESLVRVTFENKAIPWLAESYTIADDVKSITLKIRKGVKFHDMSDFNGAVAKWNLDQLIAAKVSSAASWASVDLLDDYTIRINLSTFKNSLLNDLSVSMVSQEAFNKVGKEGLRWNPVGTGPFKFVSYQRDVSLKYTKFANYWQPGKPYLDGIEYSFITDPMTQAAAFTNKEADSIGDNIGKAMTDLLATVKGCYIQSNPSGMIGMVSDSAVDTSPFARLKVRQAVDYAIDRAAITKVRGFGYNVPIYQFAFPGTPNYITNLQERKYDPAKAKQLLADAGYPNGFNTTLTCDAGSADKDSMTAVQGYLDAVGIKATFNFADNASYIKARTSSWSGLLAGAIGLDANENNSMARYYIKSATNYPNMIKSAEFDTMYMTSLTSKNYDPALMQKMIIYLYDNALVNGLWTINHANICQSYVHDGGFMSMQTWPGWTPDTCWMEKH